MNILFSAEGYPTPEQPFSAFIGEICREFVRQGHEVTVIAPQSLTAKIKKQEILTPTYFEDIVDSFGIIHVYRPYYITLGYGCFKNISIYSKKRAFLKVANQLNKFDVCYAHFWASGYNVLEYAINNKLPLFVASGEDTIVFNNYVSKAKLIKFRDYVKGVICVSTKNQDESIKAGLTIREKCKVFPNAIDNTVFYKHNKYESRKILGISDDDFVIAFVGRFYKRKGINILCEAIKLLNDSQIKSIFIGRPTPGEVEDPSCEGIIFKGALEHCKIPVYLSAADVFVLPSLAEGCSNAIVEAMACGLPIISSDLPFNYDILSKENSFMINPQDVNAIASSIKTLKDNPNIRKSMSDNSLALAKELTLDKRASKILEFISL